MAEQKQKPAQDDKKRKKRKRRVVSRDEAQAKSFLEFTKSNSSKE